MNPVLWMLVLAAGSIGCSGNPRLLPDPVSVQGRVTQVDGKPVKNVVLTLQPTERGHGAGFSVKADGSFTGEIVPGNYAFFFTQQTGKTAADNRVFEAALKAIPAKYRNANLENAVQVKAGAGGLDINLN